LIRGLCSELASYHNTFTKLPDTLTLAALPKQNRFRGGHALVGTYFAVG